MQVFLLRADEASGTFFLVSEFLRNDICCCDSQSVYTTTFNSIDVTLVEVQSLSSIVCDLTLGAVHTTCITRKENSLRLKKTIACVLFLTVGIRVRRLPASTKSNT